MSFFHTCSLVLSFRDEVRVSAIARLVNDLKPVMVIGSVGYRLGDGEMILSQSWLGEKVSSGVLSRFDPSAGDMLTSLRNRSDTRFWLSAELAVKHCAPPLREPDWFGRWNMGNGSLQEIVQMRINTLAGEPSECEVVFPLVGYPLTASRLTDGTAVVDGDEDTARRNRATILPVVSKVRTAFGLTKQTSRWSLTGEAKFDYPDDFEDLESWAKQLNET